MWAADREHLWKAVEAAEYRRDAQLAREVDVALPPVLTTEQQLELLRDFALDEFVSLGMVADIALSGDNTEHPSGQTLLTTRRLTAYGFGPKAREWNSRDLLGHWRQRWDTAVRRALRLAAQLRRGSQQAVSSASPLR